MPKNIELEIRGEVTKREIPALKKRILALGFTHDSSTRRTSIMSFGHVIPNPERKVIEERFVDIRCRITNGIMELVEKLGPLNAHNRKEISVPIKTLDDLFALGKFFGAMPFWSKVGSRLNDNFINGKICITLTQSVSGYAYIEIEKITDRAHEERDHVILKKIADELGILLWKTKEELCTFCDRLDQIEDWRFYGTDADIKRLKKEIKKIGSDREA
jgi:hypothetical protein